MTDTDYVSICKECYFHQYQVTCGFIPNVQFRLLDNEQSYTCYTCDKKYITNWNIILRIVL
jgi:hypothetical protein